MRQKSRSPVRRSNSPSRVAAALQNSQGVGGAPSYLNRSPLNFSNKRGVSGSPLRQKSPAARYDDPPSNNATLPQASFRSRGHPNPPILDENIVRMKKSCERIAAVLGLPRDCSNEPAVGTSTSKRPSVPANIHKAHDHVF